MSILTTDLVAYGVASLPLDDVSTTGGAIDATRRPVFTQMTTNSTVRVISSAADTRTVTLVGRNAAGAVITETLTLNGTTAVISTNTFERLQSVNLSATNASNTVTVTDSGNTVTYGTVPPNETGFYALFLNSASASTAQTRYEKFFWKNTNATLTLTIAQVTLTADHGTGPAGVITMGLTATVNDTGTVANRTTAPAGITFVSTNVAQNVPGNALAAAAAVGTWIKQSLTANQAAIKDSFTTQLAGQST